MSPLQLEILLWYRGHAADFREGDFSAPAVRAAIDEFRDKDGMIESEPNKELRRTYRLTERGHVFVNAMCDMPLPEACWVMPSIQCKTVGSTFSGAEGDRRDENQ